MSKLEWRLKTIWKSILIEIELQINRIINWNYRKPVDLLQGQLKRKLNFIENWLTLCAIDSISKHAKTFRWVSYSNTTLYASKSLVSQLGTLDQKFSKIRWTAAKAPLVSRASKVYRTFKSPDFASMIEWFNFVWSRHGGRSRLQIHTAAKNPNKVIT